MASFIVYDLLNSVVRQLVIAANNPLDASFNPTGCIQLPLSSVLYPALTSTSFQAYLNSVIAAAQANGITV